MLTSNALVFQWCLFKKIYFSTDAEGFLISAWPCNVFYLLYELKLFIEISTTDKNCSLMCYSLYLVPWTFRSQSVFEMQIKSTTYSSLVRCLYNKQNMTRMLGAMEFLFLCSTRCLTCSCTNLWDIKLNTQINSISLCACVISSIYFPQMKHSAAK